MTDLSKLTDVELLRYVLDILNKEGDVTHEQLSELDMINEELGRREIQKGTLQ